MQIGKSICASTRLRNSFMLNEAATTHSMVVIKSLKVFLFYNCASIAYWDDSVILIQKTYESYKCTKLTVRNTAELETTAHRLKADAC